MGRIRGLFLPLGFLPLELVVSLRSKRRLSLLLLPTVIAAGLFATLQVGEQRQQARIVELSERAAHADARDAIAAVQELAAMVRPPVKALVKAATSEQREAASVAQASIDQLLRRWQRDVESNTRTRVITGQLKELAESLGEAHPKFARADHAWLVSMVRRILRVANGLPAGEALLVAMHCDAALSVIGPGDFREKPEALPGTIVFDDMLLPSRLSAAAVATAPVATVPLVDGESGEDAGTPEEKAPATYAPPLSAEPLAKAGEAGCDAVQDSTTMNELRPSTEQAVQLPDVAPDVLAPRKAIAPRLANAPPIFSILPNAPSGGLSGIDSSNRSDQGSAAERGVSNTDGPLASVATRELLKTWLQASPSEGETVSRELSRRGFGKLSTPLVQQYFSEDPQERTRVVQKALAQRNGGAEGWLLLLTTDSDADVRLFAVTFMATSNNAALMEKAWQIAIRDHDPRIADLASRLRQRRDGPIRR